MAKHLARILLYATQSVGRAFVKAVRQEIEASEEAARYLRAVNGPYINPNDLPIKGMTLCEAQQILNVSNMEDRDQIENNYKHLFNVNCKLTGGSFYLQSKVFRAKERLDQEFKQKLSKQTDPHKDDPLKKKQDKQ
ncbi:mitochondrial import inner membrane translocase subunit tim16-B [Drosophila tropicalis]|uniref:mitochondrial import inner membrane translocase subunit tim16-B n=1 Tax=Drosophila tropicalis TaxID=46794 RepID=UPI0035AB929E